MKRLLVAVLLLSVFYGFSQDVSRFGLIAGANQYSMGADFLNTKSGTGLTVGIATTIPISEYSEIVTEITYNRYNFQIEGRETMTSDPEWIKFGADKVNFTAVYDYNIVHFMKEDFSIGLCAGPTASIYNKMGLKDNAKENYLLGSYYIPAVELTTQDQYDSLIFNLFGTVGVTGRYRNLEGSLRYNFGLTNAYEDLQFTSTFAELTGKDNFISFHLTYFFGDYF